MTFRKEYGQKIYHTYLTVYNIAHHPKPIAVIEGLEGDQDSDSLDLTNMHFAASWGEDTNKRKENKQSRLAQRK